MDEKKLIYKYQVLCDVRDACEQTIELYQNPREGVTDVELNAYIASLIKHNELVFEMLWKFLKYFLSFHYGVESLSPKSIFRDCLDQKIISDDQLTVLMAAAQQRNTTVHVYDSEVVKEQCKEIITNFSVISNLIDKLGVTKQ